MWGGTQSEYSFSCLSTQNRFPANTEVAHGIRWLWTVTVCSNLGSEPQ